MWVQMSVFFVSQPSYYPIIFQHSHSAWFFFVILSIIKAIAPPGTPGAATMVMPSIKINPANKGKSNGIPCIIINASAQATIFSVLPDRWMVAKSGITKPATSADTPFFLLCSSVTGMVAAEDCVPNAVK